MKVVVRFDTFVCTLIFEMYNVILSPKYNIFELGVLCCQNFECSAVCPSGYLPESYHVYKLGCLLLHGIALPAAQLFVIAIENILRGVCEQFNEIGLRTALAERLKIQSGGNIFQIKHHFFVATASSALPGRGGNTGNGDHPHGGGTTHGLFYFAVWPSQS